MNKIIDYIKENNIGKYIENESLKKLTTYRVGGVVALVVYPKDENKLIMLIKLLRNNNIKYKIIGNGSNLLFSDKPYDGVLIKLDNLDECEFNDNIIKVGAGYSLIKLSLQAMKNSLTGLEFAAGIPGTVGGAVFMNAGAYKSDMGYIVRSVRVLTKDLQIINLANSEMNFHYRTSFLKEHPDYICLGCVIKLKHGKKHLIEEVMKERKKRRVVSQPLEYPSAGSVFRNPPDNFAGKLIEDLGLKGKYIGKAQISDKHANFIINKGGATAKDIKDLMDLVKSEVKEKYNIELKEEQELVNWE
ncbi:MAG: UDP-N-acetylmuramate dehydrogenase [Bacilli bacterium]